MWSELYLPVLLEFLFISIFSHFDEVRYKFVFVFHFFYLNALPIIVWRKWWDVSVCRSEIIADHKNKPRARSYFINHIIITRLRFDLLRSTLIALRGIRGRSTSQYLKLQDVSFNLILQNTSFEVSYIFICKFCRYFTVVFILYTILGTKWSQPTTLEDSWCTVHKQEPLWYTCCKVS